MKRTIKKMDYGVLIVIVLVFLVIIAMNFRLIFRMTSEQTGEQNKIEIDTNNNYDSSETTSVFGKSSDKNLDSSAEQVCWDGLTEDGIDEEVFLEDLNLEILQEVAGNLQSAVDEEIQDEKDNPEIVLTEGWIRIFDKQQYKDVVSIGRPAMKPLYWILYKSDNNDIYEYLCASALQEISGVTFEDNQSGTQGWSTAKEYLDLFTKEILSEEEVNNISLESEEAGNGNIDRDNPPINWGLPDGPELTAREYYSNTVFEVVSLEVLKSSKTYVLFEVTAKKDGVMVDPNRTIELRYEDDAWKVINEGY